MRLVVIEYIYFRFFKLGKFMAMGMRHPHYRAAFMASLAIFFNSATLLALVDFKLSRDKSIFWLFVYFGWYFLCAKFFNNRNRYKLAMRQFGQEMFLQSVIGNFLTALYVIFSIGVFIVVSSH